MLGEHQSIVPNFTLYPTPNPNPNSSPFPNSQTPDSPAYQHVGVVMSTTTNVSPIMHSAGNFGVMTRPIMNIIQPVHCEVCNIICNTMGMLEKHKQGKKHLKNLQKVSNLLTVQAPSIENAPKVGELENKKLTLLKNGASVDTLISCDLCNVICNNQDVFRAHVAGKKHCAKAVIQAANANGLLDSTLASLNKPDKTYQCELCKISCTSGELLNLHLAGKKHQKKLKESEQIPIAALVTSPGKSVENAEATESNTVILQEVKPVVSQEDKPVISQEDKPVISQEGKPVSCELCGINCTSYEVLKTHMSGKKHQKNLEKSEKTIGPNPATIVIEPVTEPVTESVTEPATESVTEPVTQPTPEVTPLVIGPQKQDSPKEEGKITNVSGSKKKAKRRGNHEDVETKKQKILEGGGTVDAMRTCTVCQVVCSSPDVYISHLAGSKHAAMALKQAEAQAQAQATGEET